jgi:mannose-6-phosphate isomerase-like protein (cupin superfamily)
MSAYVKVNLLELNDIATAMGMGGYGEARFARDAVGAQRIGAAHHRVNPGRRVGFGHRHENDEEMYLVLAGSGRFKVDDEVIEVGPRDLVFVPASSMREWEAGADGMEMVAFGSHGGGAEREIGWWSD